MALQRQLSEVAGFDTPFHDELSRRLKNVNEMLACVRCLGWGCDSSDLLFEGIGDVQVDDLLEDEWCRLKETGTRHSPLFKKVLQLLQVHRRANTFLRAIIFVQTRRTARKICRALKNASQIYTDLCWLSPTVLLGHNARDEDGHFSMAMQNTALREFEQGVTNVLVATSVAEEGLDIAACNFVARLDPPHSAIAFIQARGRARYPDSSYHMLCISDDEIRQVSRILALEQSIEQTLQSMKPRAPAANNWDIFNSPFAGVVPALSLGLSSNPDSFPRGRSRSPRRGSGTKGPSFIDGKDYKSELNIFLQQRDRRNNTCRYLVVEQLPPDLFRSEVHIIADNLRCVGEASQTLKGSEQSAAKVALQRLSVLKNM
jgi:superfamily II DNA/RNA helicase